MYEAHFGLNKRPFASVPRVDQYFPGAAIEGARQTLTRCIQRAEGTSIVIGPSGTGKTLLCQTLVEQFKDTFQTVHLSSGRLSTRRALLQAILFGLGQPYRGMDEGELRLSLVDYLTLGDKCTDGMLLLVDEAHTLPLRLVDEIRMITNLVSQGQPRVRLALAGSPALEERLASPKLESFNQRIVARCYLESFNREETRQYVEAQTKGAGVTPSKLFASDVYPAIHQATDGVPRLINQLCDHALLLAFARGQRQISRATIEEAWADLQQLPTPWTGGEAKEEENNVIEFGGLDDEPSESDDTMAQPAPALRVALTPDESAPNPAAQVAEIQQALASLDDDFQPAGAIRPEMELVFDDLSNPFSEEFEEEEIVVDRYTTICRSSQQEHPMVFTRQESEQLQPLRPAASVSPSVAAPAASAPPEPRAYPAEHAYETPAATANPVELETVPLRAESPAPVDDESLIVVEDDYDDDVPRPHKPAPVRRQEYRQLFAHLRRSC
jgi:type II secretory pathway predicted ATPase ExeA